MSQLGVRGIATGMQCTGASDAAKLPPTYRTVLTTKNYPAQVVCSAEVRSCCSGGSMLLRRIILSLILLNIFFFLNPELKSQEPEA